MPTTPTVVPGELIAGNTFKFEISYSEYPASTWTVTYYLRGPSAPADIVAVASGDIHTVEVLPAVTATWNDGRYKWQAYAVAGTERYLAGEGVLDVTKDFSKADVTHEARTHAKICLDQIESVLVDRTQEDVQSYSIRGRQLVMMTDEALLRLRNYYRAEVRAEENAEAIARGETRSKQIKVRFTE